MNKYNTKIYKRNNHKQGIRHYTVVTNNNIHNKKKTNVLNSNNKLYTINYSYNKKSLSFDKDDYLNVVT